jgi:hypothetical protein
MKTLAARMIQDVLTQARIYPNRVDDSGGAYFKYPEEHDEVFTTVPGCIIGHALAMEGIDPRDSRIQAHNEENFFALVTDPQVHIVGALHHKLWLMAVQGSQDAWLTWGQSVKPRHEYIHSAVVDSGITYNDAEYREIMQLVRSVNG